MSNYIPEEQEGQFRTDEQAAPSTEYARDEKEFDPSHPPVAQPKNPTPAASQQAREFRQEEQMESSEQEDRTAAQQAAYPDASGPVLSSFAPASASVGATVTIRGSGLTGTTAVLFHGVASTNVTVLDDSTVNAVIPVGATTGTISLSAPSGTSETNVASQTVISSSSLTIV
jgi:hypothetical protein